MVKETVYSTYLGILGLVVIANKEVHRAFSQLRFMRQVSSLTLIIE